MYADIRNSGLRTISGRWVYFMCRASVYAEVAKRRAKVIVKSRRIVIIVIIGQPLCPVVGRRPQHAVSKLACLVLSSARSYRSSICPGHLSTAWLVSLVVFSCHTIFYGLQVVTRVVHRSSLRRLICPAQDHFIFPTLLIISMTFVFSLTQMLVFLSLYVMLSILLSILVCAAASLFCACLVSVQGAVAGIRRKGLSDGLTLTRWRNAIFRVAGATN